MNIIEVFTAADEETDLAKWKFELGLKPTLRKLRKTIFVSHIIDHI